MKVTHHKMPGRPDGEVPAAERTFRWRLALITVVGLVLRLTYIVGERRLDLETLAGPGDRVRVPLGDGAYYHLAANYLVAGKGWIHPYSYVLAGQARASANHPPAWILVLALATVLGLKSVFAHQIVAGLVGAATVGVTGLAARRIAGARVGLIAAGIAAVYPNFWLYERELLSETLLLLGVAVAILLAYRFLDRPNATRVAATGAACGICALTRPEQVLIFALFLVPLVLIANATSWKQRLSWIALGVTAAGVVVAPWAVYNLNRFDRPEYVSSSLGLAMVFSNCPATYSGPELGYLGQQCPKAATTASERQLEPSRLDYLMRGRALHYARDHVRQVPLVVLAREGRTWSVFRPWQQMRFDATWGSPVWVNDLGLYTYWALLPAALAGAAILRRRRRPVAPLFAFVATIAIASAITLGQTRYRAGAEVVVVVLAAVAFDAWTQRFRPTPHRREDG